MSIKKNVVSATTTTNSGKSVNNNINNVEMNNPQVEKVESVEVSSPSGESVESVENAEVKAEDVEVNGESVVNGVVRSQKRVELKRGSMYYAWSHNSCDTQRLVLVTFVEEKRDGKRMIDYVMIEPDKYIGQNEKHEALFTYKLHKYHKSSKWSGGADAPEIGEFVDGPNGVCVYPGELTIEDVKFTTTFDHGCLRLDDEMYEEWGEWLNSKVDVFGLTAMLYGVGKAKEVFEKEIEKHVEMLDGNIVSVKWLVDGEKRCDSLTAEVGYDDDGKLVLRLHDNYIERTGLTNMVFPMADMEFRIDTKEKIKLAATYIQRAIHARR